MDQKIENLLNISLNATEEEREKSLNLDIGYDSRENQWEIIVKYNGNLEFLREKYPGTVVEMLLGGYAVIITREEFIEPIAAENVIDYVEKPKSLYFGLEYSKIASCIYTNGVSQGALTGRGIITAVIDSGIDVLNPEFRNPDGTTRILNIWDQGMQNTGINQSIPTETGQNGNRAAVLQGREYTGEEINEAIRNNERIAYDPGQHGTNVALIACGNSGVAYESDILVVKLGVSRKNSFPRTIEVMRAFDYVIRKSMEYGKPAAINLSLGNNYGSHDGTSILENYIDAVFNIWRTVICIGTGNEAARGTHTSGILSDDEEKIIQFSVGDFETSINIQIWKEYADEFEVELISPSGQTIGPVKERNQVERFRSNNTEILGFFGEPGPYSSAQEIYFDFLPVNDYIDGGIWRIRLIPERIVNGRYEMWLPSAAVLNDNTRFLDNSAVLTQTIPSTAGRAIGVGAYDPRRDAYGDFSGRGYLCSNNRVKPDLVAPGVGIVLEAGTIRERSVTGTSFATPFVTGAAACLMQWGITDGNDPYLYGEKVKAYLTRGARQLPGFYETPNEVTGWGSLCLADSIPI